MYRNPYFDPAKKHHRPGGFQNSHESFRGKRWHELLRWKWAAWRAGAPYPSAAPIPVTPPDLNFIHANARAGLTMQPAVTWIGHITVLAQFGGLNFLTDPVFSERCSPLQWAGPKRHTPPALTMAQLPRIDVVLVSHSHYDHLDEASILAMGAQQGGSPLFIVPLGLKPWLAKRGIHHAVELDWWDEHVIEGAPAHSRVALTLTPTRHWSARTPTDAMRTLWGAFAVRAPDCHLFFGGDTAYSRDFIDTRDHFAAEQTAQLGGGFDIALLPIGAYEPRWFMKDQHVNPTEAVQIFKDLGCKRALAVHWGTFQLTDEALDEPPRALSRALQAQNINGQDFQVLAIGQTWHLPQRVPMPD